MRFKFKLPKKLKEFLKNSQLTEVSIGCSNSQVIKVEKNNNVFYLKVASKGLLINEHSKLKWLQGKTMVPRIVMYEINDEAEFLLTEEIKGEMVCSDYYLKNPKFGLQIVIEAFKELYRIDIEDCPFNVALSYKLNLVKYNLDNNLININDVDSEVVKRFKNLNNIYEYLLNNSFEEELCFSHGDISLPNIFALNNTFNGFIDVGDCGVADKWFDIAIATRTIIRNYGSEYLDDFYKGIGIVQDKQKIDYYLLMMELYL